MAKKTNTKKDIRLDVFKGVLYNEMLQTLGKTWLSVEEGNRNMKRRLEVGRRNSG
jgi:hypothetical protein